jgi:hypothetical protein
LLSNPKQLHQQVELSAEQEELQQLEDEHLAPEELEKRQQAIIQRMHQAEEQKQKERYENFYQLLEKEGVEDLKNATEDLTGIQSIHDL